MEIIFLGTTAAVPSAKRGHSAIALKYHNEVILWDCGEGTQRQLIRSRTSYMKIKNIFITHFHGDHFLGLPGLIQTLSFSDRSKPLNIYGPKGIKELIEMILGLGEYELGFRVIPGEISDAYEVKEEKYTIRCVEVDHNIPTYGLIFEEEKGREFLIDKALKLGLKPGPAYSKLQRGEKVRIGNKEILPEDVLGERKKGLKVVYSSDTRPCENVRNNCEGATLIHDGTFDESLKENAIETKHSTSVEASVIAREGGAKSLFLTHISPRYKNDDVLYEQAKKAFKNVIIAKDLLKVTL